MTAEPALGAQVHGERAVAWPFPLDDPYPAYAAMRSKDPVQWSDELTAWLVLSHQHAMAVLRGPGWSADPRHNPDLFERLGGNRPGGSLLAKMLLFTDPPDHDRLRRAVNRFFTRQRVEDLQPRIATMTSAAFAVLPTDTPVEVMASVARSLPLAVICELLGVDTEVAELLAAETPTLAAVLDPLATEADRQASAASGLALMLALVPIVAERRRSPGEDLLTALVEVLDADDAIVMALLLLAAGHETTANLIGNGIVALAQHPDQFQLLRQNPLLLPTAVEELLRWDSPVQVVGRVARAATMLGGHHVATGEQVLVILGATNRDPAVFPRPDRLDVTRHGAGALAFGHGAHYCVGAALARAEAAEVFRRLITGTAPLRVIDWARPPSTTFRRLSWLTMLA
ncbi:MAG: cytochrome P450 [Actinomycetota bacterium]|nr:cytochrome P450 [Actinomycetota bacterium]